MANLIIEGDHDYGEELVWDYAMWLCNRLLPDIGYEVVVTFRRFSKKHDGDMQGYHINFDDDSHEITINKKTPKNNR